MADNPFDFGTDETEKDDKSAAMRRAFERVQPPVTAQKRGRGGVFSFDETSPDAQLSIKISQDGMAAVALAKAPETGGKGLGRQTVSNALKRAQIGYGLDERALARLLRPTYGEEIVIAAGNKPLHPSQPICKEVYPRIERQPAPFAGERANYTESGFFREIKAGDVIATVRYAEEKETTGTDVFGQPVEAVWPESTDLPIGQGVALAEDGKKIVARQGGNLVYRDGCYHVEKELVVQELLYGVGDLFFPGSISIECDVVGGYYIETGESVTLKGAVKGATIVAAKDINIASGATVTDQTQLTAGRRVDAHKLRNVTVRAGEEVAASVLNNCQTECDGDVRVTQNSGQIIAGKTTAFGSVYARQIGAKDRQNTTVILGLTPNQLEKRKALKAEIHSAEEQWEQLANSVAYVQRLMEQGLPVSDEDIGMLKRVRGELAAIQQRKQNAAAQSDAFEKRLSRLNQAVMQAEKLLPPVKLFSGAKSINITKPMNKVHAFINADGYLQLQER